MAQPAHDPAHDNVIPLIDVAIAHRNRLFDRSRRAGIADSVALGNAVIQIDRWLIRFACTRTEAEYWAASEAGGTVSNN